MPVFAFTDIEGSTGLWEKHQDAMGPVIARHYAILQQVLDRLGGRIIKKTGDGIFGLFPDEDGERPSPALTCAIELQRRFQEESWPVIGELRVRMAFHCGQAEEMAGDYYGPTANRTARLMSLGWGGQILVSEDLRRAAILPEGASWQDLGLHQVKDLPEPQQIYGLLHPSLALQEFPALKSVSSRPHNLPEQLSPFVARQRELKDLALLLAGKRSRLVTLLGGAGMGKSRLAVQAALENVGSFRHGANLVSLDGLTSPDELPARMAESLKLSSHRQKDPRERLQEYLKDKQLLLILDPCEGLAGGGGWISNLMEACPGLCVLACSRRRLNLRGEAVVDVRGLDYPAEVAPEGFASGGCVRFFVQQVRAFQPTYSMKPDDRPWFLRICRVLDGMPLGLELAAGWLRSFPMKTLAERIEQDPRFLSSTRQDLPADHRSLKALFESAWGQLTSPERRLLAQLSVFSGGFTSATAGQSFRAAPEALSGLADQCLLEPAGDGRWALSGAARFFAAARLDEQPDLRDEALDLHARHFCRLLKERERNLLGHDQARAVAELRLEHPNLQRAWDRALDKSWGRELAQAARCIGLYADMQGLARDWEPRMERGLQLCEASGGSFEGLGQEEALALQACLQANRANHLFTLGRGQAAREAIERSLALSRKGANRQGVAYALVRLSVFLGPEDERRLPALEEAAGIYQALGDANGLAWARRNLGYLLCLQRRAAQGRPLLEESLTVFRKVGNQREIGWCLSALAQAALDAGDDDAGMQGLREARDAFTGLGDIETAAWTLSRLGREAMKRRLWGEARASLEESLRLFGRLRHFRGRAQAMRSLCELCAAQGDLPTAFEIVDKAIAEAHAAGDLSGQAGALMQKAQLLKGQGRLDDALALLQAAHATFAKAASELGQALALESQGCAFLAMERPVPARRQFELAADAFIQAQAQDGEARLCVRLGDLDAAEGKQQGGEGYYKKALKLSRLSKPGDYSLGALLGLAAAWARIGRKLEALHLALVCERALELGMMPASEPEFHADLARRADAVLAQIGGRLMRSVIDEARAKVAREDARALVKECVEKNWT